MRYTKAEKLRTATFPALIAALFFVVTGAAARDQASLGFSTERLQRIDAHMAAAIEDGLTVGGHGLIARHGRIVYQRNWGDADREADTPARDDTLYRIYSMTKPVTSVALLMLYEEGHFLLSDPVQKYLPEYADAQVSLEIENGESTLRPVQRPATIRDLLRHTAGLSYGIFGDSAVDKSYLDAGLFMKPTLEDFSRTLGELPLRYDPGTRWHYSVAVDVQGRLIEVVSGKSLGEFFRERIFEPLGMRDTYFHLPESKRDRLAQLYTPRGAYAGWNQPWRFNGETALEVADPKLTHPYLEDGYFESGGAGLISSAPDYLRFALMLLGEGALGDVRLLAPGTVRLLRRNHLAGIDDSELQGLDGFGLGVGIAADPPRKSAELGPPGAFGWGGAAGTNFWVDPKHGIVGIFMVQSIPHQTQLAQEFQILTYQAFME